MADVTDNAPGGGAGGASGTETRDPAPWYAGLAPEDQGRLQNLGWDKLPPDQAALAAFKSFRDTQAKLGAPADELIRLRKDPTDAAYATDMAAMWERLGKPKEATGYDFSPLGEAATAHEKYLAALREQAFKANLPATTALELADFHVKQRTVEAKEAADAAAEVARLEAQKLEVNWGSNRDVNMFYAKKGGELAGFKAEAIEAIARTAGGADALEGLRRIGAASTEARFIPGGDTAAQPEMTYEQALARKDEMMGDRVWFDKFDRGDAEAKREFHKVTQAITRGMMTQRGQR